MNSVTINLTQVITQSDIKQVATLASKIWHQHFTPIIGLAQVEYMIEKFQSFDAISSQINQEGFLYYLIHDQHQPVGYTGIKLADEELFLSKLYIVQECRGQGIGRRAIEFISAIAIDANVSKIRLTVNRNNRDTINAYQHFGFEIIDEVIADIGNGFVMDDFIMALELTGHK